MLLAVVLLVVGMYAVGAAMNTLAPFFVLLGRLPGWELLSALGFAVLAWRTWYGHRLLGKLAEFLPSVLPVADGVAA